MRAEPWPMTCRARSRSRVPPASTRPRGTVALVTARMAVVVPRVGRRRPVARSETVAGARPRRRRWRGRCRRPGAGGGRGRGRRRGRPAGAAGRRGAGRERRGCWCSSQLTSAWWSGWRGWGWLVRRAEFRVRVISASGRPAWRAAAASGLRSAAGSVSRARLAAQNRPALRLPSGWAATQRARWPRSRPGAWRCRGWGRRGWRWGCRRRVTAAQSRAPWPPVVAEELVGLAADLGGRGQDVAAGRAEVQVVAGQVAVALGGAGEVGVQAAAGGADVGGGAVQQPGVAEPAEAPEPVAGRAVLVDVQDVGAGGAGGDGQVPAGVAAEPGGDLLLGSVVASR